jgi:hypothetical protein
LKGIRSRERKRYRALNKREALYSFKKLILNANLKPCPMFSRMPKKVRGKLLLLLKIFRKNILLR